MKASNSAHELVSTPNPDASPLPAPRVAVIVPAYGVAHLLAEALHSLQAQQFTDWECIVIDDGAPDDVAGAVAPFLSDPRIRFLATDNRGVSCARNRAIRATRAPLITLLDGDDLLRPHYLATMVPLLEGDPTVRLATCNARIFGAVPVERLSFTSKQGRGDGLHGSLADVLDRSFGVYIGTTFRRADFDAVAGFDETMTHSEDFDFWVRLMMQGGRARFVDDVMGDYRVRGESASAQGQRMLMGNLKVYQKARAALPADHPEQPLIAQLIAQQEGAIAFERSIDRVIGGDIKAIAGLRARPDLQGPLLRIALSLWWLFPSLAGPMLRWRRRAHTRGASSRRLIRRLSSAES